MCQTEKLPNLNHRLIAAKKLGGFDQNENLFVVFYCGINGGNVIRTCRNKMC